MVGDRHWGTDGDAKYYWDDSRSQWVLSCDFSECVPKFYRDNYRSQPEKPEFIDTTISLYQPNYALVKDKNGKDVEISFGLGSSTEIHFTSSQDSRFTKILINLVCDIDQNKRFIFIRI